MGNLVVGLQAFAEARRLHHEYEKRNNDVYMSLRDVTAEGEWCLCLGLGYQWLSGDKADYKRSFYWLKRACEQHCVEAHYHLALCFAYGLGTNADCAKAVLHMEQAANQGHKSAMYNLALWYESGAVTVADSEQYCEWMKKSLHRGCTEAWNKLLRDQQNGIGLFGGDFTAFEKWLGIGAVHGDDKLKERYANCYLMGIGVDRQIVKGLLIAIMYAQQNNVYCQYRLWQWYIDTDREEALKWLELAAKNGHAVSQYQLGRCYLRGKYMERNLKKAEYWLREAGNNGSGEAATALGDFYIGNKDGHRNYKAALHWYRQGAEVLGDIRCKYQVGECYFYGYGTDVDNREAIRWYTLAAEGRYAPAQFMLGRHYFYYFDYKKAQHWYGLAARNGHREASFRLGEMYCDGTGVRKNSDTALYFFLQAGELGYLPAQIRLGETYENGRLGYVSEVESFRWYKKAAESGDAEALYKVGEYYLHGIGVKLDEKTALKWMQQAFNEGSDKATKFFQQWGNSKQTAKLATNLHTVLK